MTKANRGGILAVVITAVMVFPAVSSASPIHIAPQWPGGRLNGSEAARNARRDAHANEHTSGTEYSDEAEVDNLLSDPLFDDLEATLTPSFSLPIVQFDGTLPGPSQFPLTLEPSGVSNLISALVLPETALNLPDGSELVAANPAVLTTVPEPGSLLLLGSGIAGAIVRVRRRRTK